MRPSATWSPAQSGHSLLNALGVDNDPLCFQTESEDSDQPMHMPRLILVFDAYAPADLILH